MTEKNVRGQNTRLEPSEIAIFFGAGVSYPHPTNLPLARDIKKAIWLGLWSRITEMWKEFSIRPLPEDLPQLEVILDCLQTTKSGTVRKLLKVFEKKKPNDNHRLIARLGKDGAWLVTTNFDTNVEKALGDLGARVRSLYSTPKADNFKERGVGVPVLKLHGCVSHPRSIIATMSDLGNRGSIRTVSMLSFSRQKTLRLFLNKGRFKKEKGRTCFMIGYSGGDKLDILPILQTVRRCTIIKVKHNPRRRMSVKSLGVFMGQLVNSSSAKRFKWFNHELSADITRFLASLCHLCKINVASHDTLPRGKPSIVSLKNKVHTLFTPVQALQVIWRILEQTQSKENKKLGDEFRRLVFNLKLDRYLRLRKDKSIPEIDHETLADNFYMELRRGYKPMVLKSSRPILAVIKRGWIKKPLPETKEFHPSRISPQKWASICEKMGNNLAKSRESLNCRCARYMLRKAY